MDIDKWAQLKEGIKQRFEVEEEGVEDLILDTQDGQVVKGKGDFVVVQTPIGRVKLSFESKPLVLEKKMHFSHRAGQAARTEYEFSDTEMTHKLRAYKWNDIDEKWEEIDAENFA